VILVCFLHGKSWEEYCAKIAASMEPNIESFASALSDNGMAKSDNEDIDDDAIMAEAEAYAHAVRELVNPGDTSDSVANKNQIEMNNSCTAPEMDGQSGGDTPIRSLINEKAEEILSASTNDENNKVEDSTEHLEG